MFNQKVNIYLPNHKWASTCQWPQVMTVTIDVCPWNGHFKKTVESVEGGAGAAGAGILLGAAITVSLIAHM